LKNGVQAFCKSIKELDSPVKPGNDEKQGLGLFAKPSRLTNRGYLPK